LPITEASAKVRYGPPKDDEDDYELNIWAGVLPIRIEVLPPQADPKLKPGLDAPSHVTEFSIGDVRGRSVTAGV
jgi:hypothetical protein